MDRLQNCVFKTLQKCEESAPAELVDSMFRVALKGTPCVNLSKARYFKYSYAEPLLETGMRAHFNIFCGFFYDFSRQFHVKREWPAQHTVTLSQWILLHQRFFLLSAKFLQCKANCARMITCIIFNMELLFIFFLN